jgi:[ribosomal protein S5]-alanine N-acetyltransferase
MPTKLPFSLARSERVYLRHPRKVDAEEFSRLVIASRSFLQPWVTPPSTPEAYDRYLQGSRRESACAFLVCRMDDRRIVGVCNLSQILRGNLQQAFLGYWIGAAFAGRGYMTEALHLVLRYAFANLKLHRIEANVQPQNGNSKALLVRAGFRLEGFSPRYLKVVGRWRDHERWAIYREDWSAQVKEDRANPRGCRNSAIVPADGIL